MYLQSVFTVKLKNFLVLLCKIFECNCRCATLSCMILRPPASISVSSGRNSALTMNFPQPIIRDIKITDLSINENVNFVKAEALHSQSGYLNKCRLTDSTGHSQILSMGGEILVQIKGHESMDATLSLDPASPEILVLKIYSVGSIRLDNTNKEPEFVKRFDLD